MSSACFVAVLLLALAMVDGGEPRPRNICKYGFTQFCSRFNNYQCPVGSSCRMRGYGSGVCCNNAPIQGVCPPPSGMAGICVFDPERNCLKHSQCPRGHLCCSEGCGKVCKHSKTGHIYPGPLGTNAM